MNKLKVRQRAKERPSGTITVNGEIFDFSDLITFDPQSGLYVMPLTTRIIAGQEVIFKVMGDPDPFISYSVAYTNKGVDTMPFEADFFLPLTQMAAAGSMLTSMLGITLTDGGDDGINVQPYPDTVKFIQTAKGDNNDLGIDCGVGINIGTTIHGTSGSVYTDVLKGSGTSPITFNILGVHISGLLTGGGDSVALTGRLEVGDPPALVVASLSISTTV